MEILPSPDDEIGRIVGKVITGQAREASGLVYGDNSGAEEIRPCDLRSACLCGYTHMEPIPRAAERAIFLRRGICKPKRTTAG